MILAQRRTAPQPDPSDEPACARPIGGALDFQALARLNFSVLSEAEAIRAVRNMAKLGFSETTIAAACGWSREMVARALGRGRA